MSTEMLRVKHIEGDRFTVDVRGHAIEVDQPVAAGGTDLAPTPTELLVASLASCVAFYGTRFLRRHHLPEGIEVEAAWEMAQAPTRVGKIDIKVRAPGLPIALQQRFSSVVKHCTVHNTLTHEPDVSIRIAARDEGLEVAG